MRRSVREASLGFCLLAAIASGLGLWFWLKGLSLGRQTWTMEASFQDAAGLAPRSPVSYRGVMVGSVRALRVTDREVVAELTITDPKLRLALPVVARVAPSSLLGGDAAVSLLSSPIFSEAVFLSSFSFKLSDFKEPEAAVVSSSRSSGGSSVASCRAGGSNTHHHAFIIMTDLLLECGADFTAKEQNNR
jgi:hypothetical protein